MPYKITDYTKQQAEKLGLKVKSSSVKGKKIDVFSKEGEKIASVGATGYKDYPTYMKENGKAFADERKKLYNLRHKNDKGVAGILAKKLLW